MTLAQRVRDCRYSKGWGPDELASRAEIPASSKERTCIAHVGVGHLPTRQATWAKGQRRRHGPTTHPPSGLQDPLREAILPSMPRRRSDAVSPGGLREGRALAPLRLQPAHAAQFRQSSSACPRTVCAALLLLVGRVPLLPQQGLDSSVG